MLIMEYEFKRGLFFVRLTGDIDRGNYVNFTWELDNIINSVGLNKIVINIDNVENINKNSLNKLFSYIKSYIYKGILIFICDNSALIKDDSVLKINYEKELYDYI